MGLRKLPKNRVYTAAQVEYMLLNSAKNMMKASTVSYANIVAYRLRDDLKWGNKRIKRFLDRCELTFNDIRNNRLSVDDISTTLLEECKIQIL
jgi:hypothetical protein